MEVGITVGVIDGHWEEDDTAEGVTNDVMKKLMVLGGLGGWVKVERRKTMTTVWRKLGGCVIKY